MKTIQDINLSPLLQIAIEHKIREAEVFLEKEKESGKITGYHIVVSPDWINDIYQYQYGESNLNEELYYKLLLNPTFEVLTIPEVTGKYNMSDLYFSEKQKATILSPLRSDKAIKKLSNAFKKTLYPEFEKATDYLSKNLSKIKTNF